MDERSVTIPIEVAAISRYLGARPYDEVHEVLSILRTLCQSVIDEKPAAQPSELRTVGVDPIGLLR